MSKLTLRRLLTKLTALALSASPATSSADTASIADELTDCDGVIDQELIDREDAAAALGRGLALALAELRPLVATQLAATWATSDDSLRRLALASSLEWTFTLVGDGMVIDHLSRDADPTVRIAAARAALARRSSVIGLGVLERLQQDSDAQVRVVAAVGRA